MHARTKTTSWISLLVCSLLYGVQLGLVVLGLLGLINRAFSKSAFALVRHVTEAAAVTVMLHGIMPLTLSLYRQ